MSDGKIGPLGLACKNYINLEKLDLFIVPENFLYFFYFFKVSLIARVSGIVRVNKYIWLVLVPE